MDSACQHWPAVLKLMVWIACYPFFFSGRRWHTRCYRDWSSDVCSSDLDLGRDLGSDGELRHRLLGQQEVDEDRIERLQGGDHRAGREELAEIDLAQAELAGEGSAQGLLVDDRLLLGDLRLGVAQVGLVVVDDGLADRL